MRKIKDRIILGAICGLIAGAIGRATNALEYKVGLTDDLISQGQVCFYPRQKQRQIPLKARSQHR